MDSSVLDLHGLHHQLIPHHEQLATFGISSSSSVHPSTLLADNFLPPPFDPPISVFWHHHHPSLSLTPQDNQMAVNPVCVPPPAYHYDPQDDCTPPGAREKRHCCQLCNKRFDRPSTLKKHMLVHTGEKAWECVICGRRFSVSSNLNRHTRRCKEKWAKSESLATNTPPPSAVSDSSERTESPPSSSSSSTNGSDDYGPASPQLTDPQNGRQFAPGPVKYETDDGIRSHDQRHVAGKTQYRRRRKGSPTEPWVPASLVGFSLTSAPRSVSTPLPAVVPNSFEERNSYAETPLEAYHPSCWTGSLVGPSYVPRGEEVSSSRYCGKLLIF